MDQLYRSTNFEQLIARLETCGILTAHSQSKSLSLSGRLQHRMEDIKPGDIYICFRGTQFDPHIHLPEALSRKPGVIVVEDQSYISKIIDIPWIVVRSGREAWSQLAALVYGDPQDQIEIIGITGTNGKTSTAWLLRQLLQKSGLANLMIGTLGAYMDQEFLATQHTTPDPPVLYNLFAHAVARGLKYAIMEVSSHSLEQKKLEPIRFSALAWTSFSRDHLDFHGNMEAYWQAKNRFFTTLAKPKARMAVAQSVQPRPSSSQGDCWLYGDSEQQIPSWQNLQTKIVNVDASGTHCQFLSREFQIDSALPLFGIHAIENLACAFLLASPFVEKQRLAAALKALEPVPGRLEMIPNSKNALIFVDYAHTPDALEKVLQTARHLCQNRLICVFGCGGNRDQGKRPLMAEAVERYADYIFLTSDNPRNEDPEKILDETQAGFRTNPSFARIVDRAEAINRAIQAAHAGDVVLIAGKGHENYQEIAGQRLPFDDRIVARQACESLANLSEAAH